jgi:hypothetical protein
MNAVTWVRSVCLVLCHQRGLITIWLAGALLLQLFLDLWSLRCFVARNWPSGLSRISQQRPGHAYRFRLLPFVQAFSLAHCGDLAPSSFVPMLCFHRCFLLRRSLISVKPIAPPAALRKTGVPFVLAPPAISRCLRWRLVPDRERAARRWQFLFPSGTAGRLRSAFPSIRDNQADH